MNRRSGYSCSCSPPSSHKHHSASHSTSSAFSASANPDEDWTKITDLAERRRIQNRIAQRNYRKKLKKRLEDLERRAASSSTSPSPEVKYVDLDLSNIPGYKGNPHVSNLSEGSSIDSRGYAPNGYDCSFSQPSDDKRMFSYQHTRQLSTSPPPMFSYQAYPSIEHGQFTSGMSNYVSYPLPVSGVVSTCLMPSATMPYQTSMPAIIKPELYEEEDMNPFSLSYASMAGVDVTSQFSYQTPAIHTPALSDSLEHSTTGSPPDYMTLPRTPLLLPLSPPLQLCESPK